MDPNTNTDPTLTTTADPTLARTPNDQAMAGDPVVTADAPTVAAPVAAPAPDARPLGGTPLAPTPAAPAVRPVDTTGVATRGPGVDMPDLPERLAQVERQLAAVMTDRDRLNERLAVVEGIPAPKTADITPQEVASWRNVMNKYFAHEVVAPGA